MRAYDWVQPPEIDETLAELGRGGMLVAGGTTVLDLLKLGHPMPTRLIDISRLGYSSIEVSDQCVTLGAMLSNADAARSQVVRERLPALSEAILSGASQQIRNAATIGGNILQATRCVYFRNPRWMCNRRIPGAGCSAESAVQPGHAILGVTDRCMAVHPSDLSVALLAVDAVVVGRSSIGDFRIPISAFYRLPDDEGAKDTNLAGGSIITAVDIPTTPVASKSGYLKLRHRASYEFASASVAAGLIVEDGFIRDISIALGGVATIPWRDRDAEHALIGKKLSATAIDEFCDRLLDGAVLNDPTAYKLALARGGVHRLIKRLATEQDRS